MSFFVDENRAMMIGNLVHQDLSFEYSYILGWDLGRTTLLDISFLDYHLNHHNLGVHQAVQVTFYDILPPSVVDPPTLLSKALLKPSWS